MKNLTKENAYDLINQLAKREEIDPEKIIKIISKSLKEAWNKDEESLGKIEINFDQEKNEFVAYNIYDIVEEVSDEKTQILRNDERIIDEKSIKEKKAFLEFDLKNLPKLVGYNVRKNIEKLILELRKEMQFQRFLPLKGEIVSGYIQSIQENFCIINLGKGLGYWDKKEWEFRDQNYLGKHLRFLLLDVQEKSDLKQIILTRKSDDFIKKLFELEIPEIKEKDIEIEKIIRIPGLISKVIVKSNRFEISPIGACIGKKGSRIKSILTEMRGERIDLVEWNENKKKLLFNLISPVEVISIVEENDGNDYTLIIPEHRMSLALYGNGRIIQKTEEYLEKRIHIKSFEKSEEDSNVVVWNGNISFNEYEMKKNLFNSK